MRLLVAAFLMLLSFPAAAQTPSPGDPHWVLVNAVDGVIRPGFLRFQEEARALHDAINRLCGYPSEAALEEGRDRFRAQVVAYSRIEFLRFGPLMEDNRAERILFWPDRKGIALRQVQQILSEYDETATALDELRGKSVAVQGLGALEYVLFGDRSERLATIEADFRCRYALTISEALVAVGEELATAWFAGDGVARRLSAPTLENADFRSETESLEALVGAMSHGLEAIRDTKLLPFLGREGESAKPKSAPFWRSGMSLRAIRSSFAGIAELFAKTLIIEATEPDSHWIGDSVAFEFKNVERAADTVTAPVAEALDDPAQKRALGYLVILTQSLQTLIGENLSQALGLSVGFSSLDGD